MDSDLIREESLYHSQRAEGSGQWMKGMVERTQHQNRQRGAASSFVPGFLSRSVRPGRGRLGFLRLPERRKDLADGAAKAGHDVLA